MRWRGRAGMLLEAVLLIFLVAMVVGQVLGQPILLGYVETGSMQPTLEPGDGFVAIPAALAGPVEEGDVVTFRAQELQGGGLTTHRVVDETERGYVTRGDDNPFADQDGDEPPVKESQIVAVVWRPGGEVLAIPGVGALVTGTQDLLQSLQRRLAALTGSSSVLGMQGLAYLLLGLSVLGYVVDLVRSGGQERRTRSRDRTRGASGHLVVVLFAAAVVLAATATMVVPSGPQEFGVVSAEQDSPGPRIIETGTSESVPYLLGNGGFVPVVTYIEPPTDGIDVQPRETVIPARSTVNATLTLSAPPATGYYRRYLVEHRYLLVLPEPTIRALHEVHPWLPIVVIDGLLGGSFYLLGRWGIGRGRLRSRSRDGPGRLARLRSRFS